MNKLLYRFIIVAAVIASLCSCNKDGDLIFLNGFGASSLVASTDEVALSTANKAKIVLSLAWKNPDLLTSDSTKTAADGLLKTYLQVSANENFENCAQTTVTNLSKAYTGDDLNSLAKGLGLTPDAQSPLYFRVMSKEGDNMSPAYSNVCKVMVTPFTIHMTSVDVLNKDKTDVIAQLFSPSENGIYTGYMKATAWLNCWFQEKDGTMWGNYGVAGHEFELSDASDAWNCWFADGKGDWYVTVDTKSKTWSAANIMTVKVNGMDMTYDSSTDSWSAVMKVDDNTRLTAQADAKEYNTTTRTSSSKDISLALADTTLAKGGTYTVTLAIQPADAQFHFSVVEGEKKPDEKPQTPLPATLSMYSKDGSTLLATLNQTETKGVYTGTYKASQWENFKFVDTENNIWYGSDPSDLFTLSSAEDAWNIWFKDDFESGTVLTITADLNTLKWSYSK
jgi:hypothetical protein